MIPQPFRRQVLHYRRWLTLEVIIIIVGIALIFATVEVSQREIFPFVTAQQNYIVAAEAAVVGILLIEIIGRIIVNRFHEEGVRAYGTYIRTIVRIAGYLVVVVSIISILAANPTLAISIGAVTGVIIGFATQTVTSNVLSGGLLVTSRIVRIGDTITVAGNTGRIVDIKLMYTVMDTETNTVFIPNSIMITTAVLRKKPSAGVQKSGSK
jgi:small-conductance mechanosensitive channel